MITTVILAILGGWTLITAFVLVIACMYSSKLTERESILWGEKMLFTEHTSGARHTSLLKGALEPERTEKALYRTSIVEN